MSSSLFDCVSCCLGRSELVQDFRTLEAEAKAAAASPAPEVHVIADPHFYSFHRVLRRPGRRAGDVILMSSSVDAEWSLGSRALHLGVDAVCAMSVFFPFFFSVSFFFFWLDLFVFALIVAHATSPFCTRTGWANHSRRWPLSRLSHSWPSWTRPIWARDAIHITICSGNILFAQCNAVSGMRPIIVWLCHGRNHMTGFVLCCVRAPSFLAARPVSGKLFISLTHSLSLTINIKSIDCFFSFLLCSFFLFSADQSSSSSIRRLQVRVCFCRAAVASFGLWRCARSYLLPLPFYR